MAFSYKGLRRNGIDSDRIYYKNFHALAANAVSVMEYQGEPETCNMLVFENALLDRTTAAIMQPRGTDILLSLPYITKYGRRDVYGYPSSIDGMTQNTWFDRVKTDDFVIFYDNVRQEGNMGLGYQTTYELIEAYAVMLWECEMAFRQNLMSSGRPVILSTDPKTKLSFANFWEMFQDFRPYIMAEKGVKVEEDIKAIDLKVSFNGESLLACRRMIWDCAMNALGYATGTTKAERQLVSEVLMNSHTDGSMINTRLASRVRGCNEVNKKFGGKIPGFDGEMAVNLRKDPLFEIATLGINGKEGL